MENVLGIRSASEGEYFVRVQKEARALGYRVHAQVEDCVDLGLPQKRHRQLDRRHTRSGWRVALELIKNPSIN